MKIKNKNGVEIFKSEHKTIRQTVEAVIKSGANLYGADLNGANLRGADLNGADIDYIDWNLSCKTRNVKICKKIAAQLAAHFCVCVCDDPEVQTAQKALLPLALQSHRAEDLGLKGGE